MTKHITLVLSVFVIVFSTVVPVYAQTPTPSTTQGFIGEIANFFGSLFHQGGQQVTTMQYHGQNMPMQGVTPGQPAPSGAYGPRPSGQPSQQMFEQMRLNRLVQQGSITQTQEQEIETELTSVQNQLKSWAQSEGINPEYVVGGPMMGAGPQQGQNVTGNQGQGQMHPMFHYKPGYGQNNQFQQNNGPQPTQP